MGILEEAAKSAKQVIRPQDEKEKKAQSTARSLLCIVSEREGEGCGKSARAES